MGLKPRTKSKFYKLPEVVLLLIFLLSAWKGMAQQREESKPESVGEKIEVLSRAAIESSQSDIHYQQVDQLWRGIAADLKDTIKNPQRYVDSDQEESTANADPLKLWRAQITAHFVNLKKVSQLRAKSIARSKNLHGYIFFFHPDRIRSIWVEFSIIPYKIRASFYGKYYWISQNIAAGWVGVVRLIAQGLLLILALSIPVIFWRLSKLAEKKLEKRKQQAFYSSFQSQWNRKLVFVLSILSAYIPWIFSLAALSFMRQLFLMGQFGEVTEFFPYLYYFIYYKIFKLTLELVLSEFASNLQTEIDSSVNKKIQETSKLLGVFLLVVYSSRAAFYSILGPSLFLALVEPLFGWAILAIVFFIAARWRAEIKSYLKATEQATLQKLAETMDGPGSLLLALPSLFVVIGHFISNQLFNWSSQFEFFRLIYARVLRIKFESSSASTGSYDDLDKKYVDLFYAGSEKLFFSEPFDEALARPIKEQLHQWLDEESTEQTVAVRGHKASGKTYFLKYLERYCEEKQISCVSLRIPTRTFTEKSVDALLEGPLERAKKEKFVLLLDDAHNLFLSTIGGFSAYRKFLEMIEGQKNIFWIATYNEYSWDFLNNIVGKNQYFRLEKLMPRWSSDQLRDLILKSHEETGFGLFYDQIFRSSQKLQSGVNATDQRYFYMLWEKSGGSPGLAVSFWLKSLQGWGSQRLKVCLPEENEVQELSQLPQEMHFIYAALFKHENLNVSEAARATNLPRPVAKQALFRGREEGFLDCEKGRYKVSLAWLSDLRKFLKGKNLLYETNR